jgi:hypothetical protein
VSPTGVTAGTSCVLTTLTSFLSIFPPLGTNYLIHYFSVSTHSVGE